MKRLPQSFLSDVMFLIALCAVLNYSQTVFSKTIFITVNVWLWSRYDLFCSWGTVYPSSITQSIIIQSINRFFRLTQFFHQQHYAFFLFKILTTVLLYLCLHYYHYYFNYWCCTWANEFRFISYIVLNIFFFDYFMKQGSFILRKLVLKLFL